MSIKSLRIRDDSGPQLYFGGGAVNELAPILAAYGASTILAVHGKLSFIDSGAEASIRGLADAYSLASFSDFFPNPNIADVRRGIEFAKLVKPDVVVGIGGGSAMDVAKAISVLGSQDGDPWNYLRGAQLAPRIPRLILIPTIAGSGSELTQFATIYADNVKYSLDHRQVYADAAIIDPDLMRSVPPGMATAAAADALSHAVESLWSMSATPPSITLAQRALELMVVAVTDCLEYGSLTDRSLLTNLAWGAAYAGAAIDVTRTTAAHALSYDLTTWLGVPHGVAVALHLRWLMRRHREASALDCRHPGGPRALRGIVEDIDDVARTHSGYSLDHLIRRLLRLGGHPEDLGSLALDPSVWSDRWHAALQNSRAGNNPSAISVDDIRAAVAGKGN